MLTTRKETAEVGQKGHRLVLTEKHLFGEFSKDRDWSSIINSETDFSLKVVININQVYRDWLYIKNAFLE